MRLKHLDLIVSMIIAVMNIVYVLLSSHSTLIGIILALPLIFVLPGYILTEAFFHKRSLDTSHRLLLSLALSLAIDILSGLILNVLPGRLQALSWALFLGLLTVVLSLFVAHLRRGAQLSKAQPLRLHFTLSTWISFGSATLVATLVAILVVLYSAPDVAQQPHPGFTQLWVLPTMQAGNSCAVRLGIRSFESTAVTYRITMTTNGAQVATWPSIRLASGEEWDRSVPIILPTGADNVSVEARLYRLDKPQVVYRQAGLTLHAGERSTGSPTQQCTTS
jgi:uncharacterized membrane protein